MKLFYKTLIVFMTLTSLDVSAQSQSKTPQQVAEEKASICKEVENTYQVIASDTRTKLAITSDVCEIVKRERKADRTILYRYSDFITLKIYSEQDLKTIKLPLEYIIYKEN